MNNHHSTYFHHPEGHLRSSFYQQKAAPSGRNITRLITMAIVMAITSTTLHAQNSTSGNTSSGVTNPTWNVNNLDVGINTTGSLGVTAGGTVANVGDGRIGVNAGSSGTANVTGGTWTNSGNLSVGSSGNGTMALSGTGAISNIDGYIGEFAGSNSTASAKFCAAGELRPTGWF